MRRPRTQLVVACALLGGAAAFIPAAPANGAVRSSLVRPQARSGVELFGKVRQINGEEFEKELGTWETPIILDVYAVWCGPCQILAPEMEKVATALDGKCRVLKIDSDEEPAVASTLQVYGLPTVLFLNNGRIIYRAEGAMPSDTILRIANEKLFGEVQEDPADKLVIKEE